MNESYDHETWQPWFRNFPVPRVHPGCSSWFSVLERLHFNRMLWSPCSRRVNSSSLYLSYLGYHWETLATVSIKTVILIKNIIHIFIRSIKKNASVFFSTLKPFLHIKSGKLWGIYLNYKDFHMIWFWKSHTPGKLIWIWSYQFFYVVRCFVWFW